MSFSRRELLKAFAAGGLVIAGKLWLPGDKLISIPSGKVFANEYGIDSTFRMIDQHTVHYVGHEDRVVSISEFIEWMKKNAAHMLREVPGDMTVHLKNSYRMDNPEHLTNGSLGQDSPREAWMSGNNHRELWSHFGSFSGDGGSFEDEFVIDHVYANEFDRPRERITTNDVGIKGWR